MTHPLIERLGDTLGKALLAEQKAENAFPAEGRIMNRKAINDSVKAAWREYDTCVMDIAEALYMGQG
jgi:hypothetical protein